MKSLSLILLVGLVLGVTAHANPGASPTSQPATSQPAEQRPSPPKGFKWHEIRELKAAFLMPDGWHHSSVSKDGTIAYRFTKEDASGTEPFLTGLTVNVARDVKGKSKVDPSLYAVHYLQNYEKGARVLKEMSLDTIGKLTRVRMEVVKKLPHIDPERKFRLHLVTIANDETGTLYVLNFGAPEADWKAAWKQGKKMTGLFFLDDDV